jgi:hypothetical protein
VSGGRKPDLSVSIKPAGEGKRVSLGAWWREDGRLKGGWDKRVRRVYVLLDDGKGGEVRVDVRKEGKWSHYLNAWEEGAAPTQAPSSSEPRPETRVYEGDDGDDIPF